MSHGFIWYNIRLDSGMESDPYRASATAGAVLKERAMSLGVIGRKCGMTRIFTENGAAVPVTVIEVLPNRVAQLRTDERDGYRAVQVTTGTRRPGRVTKPVAGHLGKAGAGAGRLVREFRLDGEEGGELEAGKEITASIFEAGQKVDVSGRTIGKGYAGVVKRHHFRTQDATHGNSLSHRAPGSIGQNQTPGRVFKGKRMSGHLGSARRTQQNLEVVRVDAERNLLLVKGAVPGARGGDLIVRPAVKAKGKRPESEIR
jgi:large subunit ribosomal protein L3